MNTILLAVTQKVLDHLMSCPDMNQRQVAIQEASPEIRVSLDSATKDRRIPLLLGHRITLVAGDTAAIWRSHNLANLAEYDALFNLLACHPDKPMLFPCELAL